MSCEHDYKHISSSTDDEGKLNVEAQCVLCDETVIFADCTMVRHDWGEPGEGIVEIPVVFE